MSMIIIVVYFARSVKYKWLPITGSLLIASALLLLSTMTVETPVWVLCVYIAVLGIGLGTSMQLLVLIVQNSFPAREVGTATRSEERRVGKECGARGPP